MVAERCSKVMEDMATGEDNQSSIHTQEMEKVLECGHGNESLIQHFLPELIKEQAMYTPTIITLIYKDGSIHMTYSELDSRFNILKIELQKRSAKADIYVGLLKENSFDPIIWLLSILNIGGVYVPMALHFQMN